MPKWCWRARTGTLQCLAGFAFVCHVGGTAALTEAASATAMRAQHAHLQQPLENNPFGRPLVLQSSESAKGLTGDIYAVVPYPFAAVSAAMHSPDHWCDVMILHINTKYCRAVAGPQGTVLRVNIGK